MPALATLPALAASECGARAACESSGRSDGNQPPANRCPGRIGVPGAPPHVVIDERQRNDRQRCRHGGPVRLQKVLRRHGGRQLRHLRRRIASALKATREGCPSGRHGWNGGSSGISPESMLGRWGSQRSCAALSGWKRKQEAEAGSRGWRRRLEAGAGWPGWQKQKMVCRLAGLWVPGSNGRGCGLRGVPTEARCAHTLGSLCSHAGLAVLTCWARCAHTLGSLTAQGMIGTFASFLPSSHHRLPAPRLPATMANALSTGGLARAWAGVRDRSAGSRKRIRSAGSQGSPSRLMRRIRYDTIGVDLL